MRFSVLLVALLFAGVMTVGCKSSSTASDDAVAAYASKCADCKVGQKCAKCKAHANKCADCKAGKKCAKCKAKGAANKAKGAANNAKGAANNAADAAKDAVGAVKAQMPK